MDNTCVMHCRDITREMGSFAMHAMDTLVVRSHSVEHVAGNHRSHPAIHTLSSLHLQEIPYANLAVIRTTCAPRSNAWRMVCRSGTLGREHGPAPARHPLAPPSPEQRNSSAFQCTRRAVGGICGSALRADLLIVEMGSWKGCYVCASK